jgi:hypothetical protein
MNKIAEKCADYFTVCSSSIPDSDKDCKRNEDSGKRSSSTFKVMQSELPRKREKSIFSV